MGYGLLYQGTRNSDVVVPHPSQDVQLQLERQCFSNCVGPALGDKPVPAFSDTMFQLIDAGLLSTLALSSSVLAVRRRRSISACTSPPATGTASRLVAPNLARGIKRKVGMYCDKLCAHMCSREGPLWPDGRIDVRTGILSCHLVVPGPAQPVGARRLPMRGVRPYRKVSKGVSAGLPKFNISAVGLLVSTLRRSLYCCDASAWFRGESLADIFRDHQTSELGRCSRPRFSTRRMDTRSHHVWWSHSWVGPTRNAATGRS